MRGDAKRRMKGTQKTNVAISQMCVARASLPRRHKGNLLPPHMGLDPLPSAPASCGMGWSG